VDPNESRGQKVVSGRGEDKIVHEVLSDAESIPVATDREAEIIAGFMKQECKQMVFVEPELEVGHYYPRIWRGGYFHSERKLYTYPIVAMTPHFDSFVTSIQRIASLCRALNDLFRVIQPSDANRQAYGYEIRSLILLACTEVECQWGAVLEANRYPGSRWTTKDYVKLRHVMRLHEYKISLSRYASYPAFSPFKNWSATSPTGSLLWYDAYNKVKHDAEKSLSLSKLEFAITTVAAAFVLLVAQFGLAHVRSYFDDRSFRLEDFPRWLPDQWYYEPPPGQAWTEVFFDFATI
jgi:hypothetical protein